MVERIRLHQNQYNKKQGVKIPLLKVLESLENFFQEVFKQGLGQSPKVLPPLLIQPPLPAGLAVQEFVEIVDDSGLAERPERG